MLRRGVIAGMSALVVLAMWVAELATLRGLDRQGSSIARALDFDEALPALREEVSRNWPTNPARGPAVVRTRLVALQVISGPRRGRIIPGCVLEPPNPQHRIHWRRGLLVPVGISVRPNGRNEATVTMPPFRFGTAMALVAVMVVALIIVSPATGLKVLACVTVMWCLGSFFLAGLLAGVWPLLATLAFSVVAVAGTVLIISGRRRTGQAALAGVAGAVLATEVLAVIAYRGLGITGLESTGARFLLDTARAQGVAFDFQGLALAGTTVILLGSACDLAVGIASAVAELCASTRGTDRKAAFRYGMAVGRDTGATMVLTLVFALIGLRFPAFLFPKVAGLSPAEVLNSEAGVLEIAQILIACTGLLLTIPLTAVAAAMFVPPHGHEQERPRMLPDASALRSNGRRTLWGILAGETVLGLGLLVAGIALGSRYRFPLPWRGDEDTPAAHLESARQSLDEERPDLALDRLWRARELAPSDPQTHVWLGHACYLMGWLEQAAGEFETASELDRRDPRPLHYLGRLYAEAGRYALAVPALESCTRLQPGNAELLCDLATAHAGLGEWGRARALAQHAARLEPDLKRAKLILDGILDHPARRWEGTAEEQHPNQP